MIDEVYGDVLTSGCVTPKENSDLLHFYEMNDITGVMTDTCVMLYSSPDCVYGSGYSTKLLPSPQVVDISVLLGHPFLSYQPCSYDIGSDRIRVSFYANPNGGYLYLILLLQ